MPAWCFLAFSEVGIGVRLGACDPGLAPRRRSIYTTQGEGQIGMAKRDSIRGRGKNIRLTPMTPEKRRYLDQQAFLESRTGDFYPKYVPYTEDQTIMACLAICESHLWGYVNPFSDEDYQELLLDIGFWIQEALYVHYWEAEPSLTWADFLALTQGREDIMEAARRVLQYFHFRCEPGMDVFEQWDILNSGAPGNYDYASRKDLNPEESPPLLVPIEELSAQVDSMVQLMEVALFIRKKEQHRSLTWKNFCAALEAEPGLTDVLARVSAGSFP